MSLPSTNADGLLNLVAELERRLSGSSPSLPLNPELSSLIPAAGTYLFVLFDGLGDMQLSHPAVADLAACRRGRLQAPFPTTTTVSLATVASGQAVASHGWLGHLMWLPDLGQVVNTLKWVDLAGQPVAYPYADLLPAPNLWERLRAAGVGVVTVQPTEFAASPLTAALYRGCRFAGYSNAAEFVEICLIEAAAPGQLVFAYWPPVDFAAHVHGMGSTEYVEALAGADRVWASLLNRVPDGITLLGTADHGMVAVAPEGKRLIRHPDYRMLDFYGDPRAVMVRGSARLIRRLRAETGAELVEETELRSWWGAGQRHPDLEGRYPQAVLLAPDSSVLLPPGFDKRLAGYHGGLTEAETAIPLLVRS
ncbi:MAG TPA: alkaline phosphatase family protein [Acidimicrobiia bacterium]|nr:alkaline phosphatase family protein [Acidimicrobiia bacterium]